MTWTGRVGNGLWDRNGRASRSNKCRTRSRSVEWEWMIVDERSTWKGVLVSLGHVNNNAGGIGRNEHDGRPNMTGNDSETPRSGQEERKKKKS